ncbi:hypothetical protein LRH25_29895 [Ideonella azotifigens]|nr:hypothetical protein [Ideonella azotifigens]
MDLRCGSRSAGMAALPRFAFTVKLLPNQALTLVPSIAAHQRVLPEAEYL